MARRADGVAVLLLVLQMMLMMLQMMIFDDGSGTNGDDNGTLSLDVSCHLLHNFFEHPIE